MKTLTAEDARDAAELCRAHLWEGVAGTLDAIASGAHEVIDRATHRAVTVESLRVLKQAMSGTIPADRVNAALAEIEEVLK